jgi:hypothetical protein
LPVSAIHEQPLQEIDNAAQIEVEEGKPARPARPPRNAHKQTKQAQYTYHNPDDDDIYQPGNEAFPPKRQLAQKLQV